MPEIAEVARIAHFLRLHLVGKRISKVWAQDDTIVFGKAGTTGADFEAAAKGKKVVSAGSQGKYFWITFDKPPHAVMHFGMTGWVHIQGERTQYENYYKKMKQGEKEDWPPRFWKFHLETDSKPPVRLAFTDPRRLGRVRLVDCPGADIRKHSPLVENGPDPVVDADLFTEDFLQKKVKARRVPVKALLLDQKFLSGIGNWVADEVLYHARLHPEQYCNEFSDAQVKSLYDAIKYVCETAVDLLGESDRFPEDWLFNYRWGKGKATAGKLPSGEKLAFITVGGRTSCYAPGLQKKTGHISAGAKVEPVENSADAAPKKGRKKAALVKEEEESEPEEKPKPAPKKKSSRRSTAIKEEESSEPEEKPVKQKRGRAPVAKDAEPTPPQKKQRRSTGAAVKDEPPAVEDGRRRSGRLRKAT